MSVKDTHTPERRALLIPGAESAIIGTTPDGRAVYSFELLVKHFTEAHKDTTDPKEAEEAAVQWIDHNVITGLRYYFCRESKGNHLTPFVIVEEPPEERGFCNTPLEELCLVREGLES